MSRRVIVMDSTTSEPMVLASASTYSELSTGYDEFFNPEDWCPMSVGVCFDSDEATFYVLSESKEWVEL